MEKMNELEKLRDDTTGDILRMLHDRVSAIEAKLEANTPQEEDGYSSMSDQELRELEESCYSAPDGVDVNDTLDIIYREQKRRAAKPHTSDTSFREAAFKILDEYYYDDNYDIEDALDDIYDLAQEHFGKEQDNGKRD